MFCRVIPSALPDRKNLAGEKFHPLLVAELNRDMAGHWVTHVTHLTFSARAGRVAKS